MLKPLFIASALFIGVLTGVGVATRPLLEQAFYPSPQPLESSQDSSSRPTLREVQVFFPHYPEANDDFTQVVPVWRTTSSLGVARFAIEQLIAGPTSAEEQEGFASVLHFQGESNCPGDFTIAITNQVAKLQFCRQVVSNGVGDDARAQQAIEATLQQFSTIDTVVILNPDGSCFADQSGLNRCLASL